MHLKTFLAVAIVGASWGVLLSGAEPPAEPRPADPAEVIRQLAKGGEVRGVGIYCPADDGFATREVKDWGQVVESLVAKEGPSGRIWDLLPKETRAALGDAKVVAKIGDFKSEEATLLKVHVATGLRKVLERPDLYTADAFKGFPLTQEIKDAIALGDKRTYVQTLRMNRALLAVAFPDVVTEMPKDYQTARVRVLEGKPIVLVLSSCCPCRWEVQLDKGATVLGVVLCGYYSQEVVGVEAPTAYRAMYTPDGKRVKFDDKYFYGYDAKHRDFPAFTTAIKDLTGKDFAGFEGLYSPKGTLTVRPSAK